MPEEKEPRVLTVLRCMGGLAPNQAARYAERCTPDEIAELEGCENGKQFSAVTDAIANRVTLVPAWTKAEESAYHDGANSVAAGEDKSDEGDEPTEE